MRVLAIGAHCDDVEIGCIGTLYYLKEKYNAEVYFIVLSYNKIRKKEQESSAKFFKVKRLIFSNFPDGRFKEHQNELEDFIKKRISRIKPQIIFAHRKYDKHPDHRAVYFATRNYICFRYWTPSSLAFKPVISFDITDYIKKKVFHLRLHESQNLLNGFLGKRIINHMRSLSKRIDKYYEGFEIY